jgi:hypothetical protein
MPARTDIDLAEFEHQWSRRRYEWGNRAIGAAILKRSRCPSEVSTSLPSSIRRKNPVGDGKTSYFPQAEAPHQGGTTPAGSR